MENFKGMLGSFRFRKRILAISDAFIIFISSVLTHELFFLFDIYRLAREDVFVSCSMSIATCFMGLLLFSCYNRLWRYFNAKDYLDCIQGVFCGLTVSLILFYMFRGYMPLRFVACHFITASAGVCMFRYIFKRAFISLIQTGRKEAGKKRTMIIGAGRACRVLLAEMANSIDDVENPISAYIPECIVDDDRTKLGMTINGVEVAGTTSDIETLCKEKKIEQILFAIPSCPVHDRQKILEICSKTNLPLKVLPFLGEFFLSKGKASALGQIRDIKVEDLLGRQPIRFDNNDIRDFIHNKVCMVTGGGGSIGSELVRQIAKYGPSQIIIVDIYENNAYDIQQELLMEYGSSLNLVTLIASVRDYFRMNQIFRTYKPDVVFHAAAHKHVPLMEHSPMEAIKNNVIGTFNIATLSLFHNVKNFVMVSTDKAVNPTNVMGASKRCCEMIVQYLSQQKNCKTVFVTTRFGNVLGSNGSVIPLFKRQIEQGKPVTVTHPDIIRYFMTIPEAVSLVMEAASIAKSSEIFVLDMGQPVKIVTLAENLIRMYGKVPYKDVEIQFTGLRPGEKIKEELLMNSEGLQKTKNELIFVGRQLEIDNENFAVRLWRLKNAASENNDELAIQALHEMVPTFVTPEEFNRRFLQETAKAG